MDFLFSYTLLKWIFPLKTSKWGVPLQNILLVYLTRNKSLILENNFLTTKEEKLKRKYYLQARNFFWPFQRLNDFPRWVLLHFSVSQAHERTLVYRNGMGVDTHPQKSFWPRARFAYLNICICIRI